MLFRYDEVCYCVHGEVNGEWRKALKLRARTGVVTLRPISASTMRTDVVSVLCS